MPVRIRLSRTPLSRNSPSYTLVATNSHLRPTAKPLETLGSYRPIPQVNPPLSRSPNGQIRGAEWGSRVYEPKTGKAEVGEKEVRWNEERVRYWLSQGALPSKTVERLLNQAGIISESHSSSQSKKVEERRSLIFRSTETQTIPLPPSQHSPNKLVMSRQRRIREAVRSAEKARGEIPVAQRSQVKAKEQTR